MKPLISFKKGDKVHLSKNFTSLEFQCSCAKCDTNIIAKELLDLIQKVRDDYGAPIRINSAYRCANKQEELRNQGYETAKGKSSHEEGWALDVSSSNMSKLLTVCEKYFKNVGVAKSFIHIDIRDGGPRRWSYDKI